jgi:transcriptional regulator with XRE-family HTH domain
MAEIIRLADHARASAGSRAASPTKSLAVKAPSDTLTMRSTRPSDGTCARVSIRDSEALDVPTRPASSSRLSPAFTRYDLRGWLLMTACYIECNSQVKGFVPPDATTGILNCATIAFMAKHVQGQHYLREWRENRGLSLRKLAALIEVEPGGDPLVSYASLSRIETGEQPFSEPILNAIAEALKVPRVVLLEMDPRKEGYIVDLLNRMDPPTRDQAVRMLELLAQTSPAA